MSWKAIQGNLYDLKGFSYYFLNRIETFFDVTIKDDFIRNETLFDVIVKYDFILV